MKFDIIELFIRQQFDSVDVTKATINPSEVPIVTPLIEIHKYSSDKSIKLKLGQSFNEFEKVKIWLILFEKIIVPLGDNLKPTNQKEIITIAIIIKKIIVFVK